MELVFELLPSLLHLRVFLGIFDSIYADDLQTTPIMTTLYPSSDAAITAMGTWSGEFLKVQLETA
jgi:hypothetical protein